ncbi:MAG: hypothetical protein ACYYKD_01390 [Rhodospirillales bacterium]
MNKFALLAIAAVAAAAVLVIFTGDAAFANECRHGGAWWDWTC